MVEVGKIGGGIRRGIRCAAPAKGITVLAIGVVVNSTSRCGGTDVDITLPASAIGVS